MPGRGGAQDEARRGWGIQGEGRPRSVLILTRARHCTGHGGNSGEQNTSVEGKESWTHDRVFIV